MTRVKFILELGKRLDGLPTNEVEDRLNFYSEMISDRIEDGLSEEEAVAAIGAVDEIAEQIIADIPLTKIVKEKIKPKRRLCVWEILLLVLGSPVWLSLLIAVFAVAISIYCSVWAVIISLWAVFVSFVGCAFGLTVGGAMLAIGGNALPGVATIGAGISCAGLAIFAFYGCKIATRAILLLTKKALRAIKSRFIKRRDSK